MHNVLMQPLPPSSFRIFSLPPKATLMHINHSFAPPLCPQKLLLCCMYEFVYSGYLLQMVSDNLWPLWLLFTEYNPCKFYLCYSPFNWWILSHHMAIPFMFFHSLVGRHLRRGKRNSILSVQNNQKRHPRLQKVKIQQNVHLKIEELESFTEKQPEFCCCVCYFTGLNQRLNFVAVLTYFCLLVKQQHLCFHVKKKNH